MSLVEKLYEWASQIKKPIKDDIFDIRYTEKPRKESLQKKIIHKYQTIDQEDSLQKSSSNDAPDISQYSEHSDHSEYCSSYYSDYSDYYSSYYSDHSAYSQEEDDGSPLIEKNVSKSNSKAISPEIKENPNKSNFTNTNFFGISSDNKSKNSDSIFNDSKKDNDSKSIENETKDNINIESNKKDDNNISFPLIKGNDSEDKKIIGAPISSGYVFDTGFKPSGFNLSQKDDTKKNALDFSNSIKPKKDGVNVTFDFSGIKSLQSSSNQAFQGFNIKSGDGSSATSQFNLNFPNNTDNETKSPFFKPLAFPSTVFS